MADRIASLLPSATEVLWFLGHGDRVVGVTFECDHPAAATTLPHLTDTIVPPGATPGEIDRLIGAAMAAGEELYRLDRALLAELDPDLIVSQDLCRVCAVASGDVDAAVRDLGCRAEVFSYDPMTLDGVLEAMVALDHLVRADGPDSAPAGPEPMAVTELRDRLRAVEAAVAERPRPSVLLLEWTDPAYSAGHWIPDQIVRAGGRPVLARAGRPSAAIGWDEVGASGAEVLVVAPCGFDEAGAAAQLAEVVDRPELADLPAVRSGRVHAIDADSLIVRPGPRLVDGVEALARLFHPGLGASDGRLEAAPGPGGSMES